MSPRLLLVVIGLLIVALQAEARTELPCVKKWGGPSLNNDFDDCGEFEEWKDFLISNGPRIGLPILIGFIMLFTCPYVFCARYCCQCCGGSRMRPDGCCCGSSHYDDMPEEQVMQEYGNTELTVAKFMPVLLVLLACAFVAISYLGAQKLGTGITEATNGLQEGIQFFRDLITNFIAQVNPPGEPPVPVDLSDFQKFEDQLDKVWSDWNNGTFKEARAYASEAANGIGYSAAVPALFLVFSLLGACCAIRTCLPCTLVTFYFLLCFIYGISATVFFAVHLPLDLVCGEIDAQLARQPGVLQWYVIPHCHNKSIVEELIKGVEKLETEAGTKACDELQEFCVPYGSIADPLTYPFNCNMNAGNCSNFTGVAAIVDTLQLRASSPETCGSAPGGRSNCTLYNCAHYCVNPQLRNESYQAYYNFTSAKRISNAFNSVIVPHLSCNALVDRLVKIAEPACNHLPDGFFDLGVGCSICLGTLIFGIIVVFRGQKRWFKKPDHPKDGFYDPQDEMGLMQPGPKQINMEQF